ncbi:MAG: hypothetical protein JWO95_2488 [Verrucomicrobiales bacterium]|nr:hypothetical protein [Verrucomicrobiales bacterium]
MKKILLVVGLAAAVIGCGQQGGGSEGARMNSQPGSIQSDPAGAGPTEKVKPGVEHPGEYPSGTNIQHSQNSNSMSGTRQQQAPFGTGRANSGSYERKNNQER